MPISITCHGCGKRIKAKDTLAGRTVPCPGCGVKLVIGSAEEVAAALLLEDAPPQTPEPKAPPPEAVIARKSVEERPTPPTRSAPPGVWAKKKPVPKPD